MGIASSASVLGFDVRMACAGMRLGVASGRGPHPQRAGRGGEGVHELPAADLYGADQ